MADKITLEDIELTKALREEQERLLKIAQDRTALLEQEARLSGEVLTSTDKIKIAAAERRKVAAEMSILLNKDAEQIDKRYQEIEKELAQSQTLSAKKIAALEAEKKLLGEIEDIKDDPEKLKRLKKELDQIDLNNKTLSRRADLAQDVTNRVGSLLGVSNQWTGTIAGQTMLLLQQEDGLERLSTAMANTFSMQNIGASLLGKVGEATVNLLREQDNAIASFKQATGASGDYSDTIVETQVELRTFGVDTATAGAATQALYKDMAAFTEITKAAQKELVGVTSLLNRFGIDAGTSSTALNTLTKGLGMTTREAAATSRELFALGSAVGIPADVIFSEFGPATTQLAAHGNRMIQVFEGVAAASKSTGIGMSNLLNIAEQFDTFEGAAQAVGKLNAILGGPYLNSIEMLNASEEERIRLLIQSMEASGRSFGELGKFEQKAIAASVGISDMAQANKLFNTSLSAYDAMQAKASAAAMSQEEFEEASRAAMSVQEKFTQVMENFAVSMKPVIEFAGMVVDGVLEIQKAAGNAGGVIIALAGGVTFLAGTLASLAAAGGVAGPMLTALSGPVVAFGNAVGAAGAAAMKGALGVLAFGAGVALIGVGIYAAAIGIKELIPGLLDVTKVLVDMPMEKLTILGLSLVTLGAIGPIVGVGLVALGLGFMGLAAGVAVLFEAMDMEKLEVLKGLVTGAGDDVKESPFVKMITAVAELDDEKVNFAKQVADVAMKYNVEVADKFSGGAPAAPFQAAAAAAAGGGAGGGGGAAAATNSAPVYLVLNNQIFGRLVSDEVAKQKGLKLNKK